MTADEFVAAIAAAGKSDSAERDYTRAWGKVRKRRKPAFNHPPDPVLELLSRYDVTKLEFWQLKFVDKKAAEIDGLWHVVNRSTDDYYILNGCVLKMYYKEAYPGETGVDSGQLLEVIVVYAQMIAAMTESIEDPFHPLLVEHANRAHAIAPGSAGFDLFGEVRRSMRR